MKQRTILAFCIAISLGYACNQSPDSKVIRKEVLNIHDKLMIDGEKVIKNKIKLDSVLYSPSVKSATDSIKIQALINRLNLADEKMMDWMHFFKDDFRGKSEQENLAYFKSEMVKIRAVEDTYIKVTRESDSVLKAYHVFPSEKMDMEHHKH